MLTSFLLTPLLLVNSWMQAVAAPYIFYKLADLPSNQVVLVLGASVHSDGSLSDILRQRVDAALSLNPSQIILSGSVSDFYSEPLAMQNYLLHKKNIQQNLILDNEGDSTLESFENVDSSHITQKLLIPTQQFHIVRAVFIARNLGLDASGFSLEDTSYLKIDDFKTRELGARIVDFCSLITYLL